jgi:UDP-N-acetylglucosamine 2-epimerase (non-hydrolysing)
VKAGTVKLVGADKQKIIEATNQLLTDEVAYKEMAKAHNPYGDGYASENILKVMQKSKL